jgi:hypothetical protein
MKLQLKQIVAICSLLLFSGCGGSSQSAPVPTASVSGKVTLDGKPLAGATISFLNKDWSSVGKTNSEGEFTLVQQAAVGENKITISKVDESQLENVEFSEDPEDGLDEGQLAAANLGDGQEGGLGDGTVPLGELISADYSDPASTILTFNVPEGGTTAATFDLTSN